MNFDLTEEQKMIRDMTRDFADEVVAPRAEEMDLTGDYPYDIIEKMAGLGMMGIPFPEEYGGSGGDWISTNLCLEELARGDAAVSALVEVTLVVAEELYTFGSEEQKKRWLTPIAKGERIGAFGLTEPNSGSDAGALRTTAVKDGDAWVLNGAKQFITNIGLDNASLVLVAAQTEKATADGKKKTATFIVPKDTPGFNLGKRYDKMAWKASATHEVILEDCRVPQENLLGDPNRGFSQHLAALQCGRIMIAAMAVGVAQACLDEALRYSKERVQFKQPIFKFQAIQFKLADMAVSIELARNVYLKASWLRDEGRSHTFEATVAKLYATEMLEKVASDAVQIHGGYGYMNEYPVSRFYKGAKLLQIVEGTSEVQRMLLGRMLAAK